jgi:hypothetical protein
MPCEIASACGKDSGELFYSDLCGHEEYRYEPYKEITETSIDFIKEYIQDARMEKPF